MSGEFLKTFFDVKPEMVGLIGKESIDETKKQWKKYIYEFSKISADEKEEFEIVAKKFLQFKQLLDSITTYQSIKKELNKEAINAS
jgi:hypothetical protein